MIPRLYHTPEDCCGCRTCANACPKDAISFDTDKYGFQYPVVNEEQCVGCQKCIKTCDFQKEGEFGHHALEGYAARHKEREIYSNSTSGGAFTALAEWVIKRGGVVYGCVFDKHFLPIHIAVNKMEDLSAMRCSKYAQSDVGLVYRDVKRKLSENKYILFTGTPCQVAGLYSFLGKQDLEKILTSDLICHGVPSPLTLQKYIHFLEKRYHSKVKSLLFRGKHFGWTNPVVDVTFENGESKWWYPIKNIYYYNFQNRNSQRLSCFRCKYSCGTRNGDITIGDFRGFQKANIKMSSKEGISCCLINTAKIADIFCEINLDMEKVDIDYIIQGNFHLRKPSQKGNDWDIVMNAVSKYGFNSPTIWLQFYKNALKAFLRRKLRRIIK